MSYDYSDSCYPHIKDVPYKGPWREAYGGIRHPAAEPPPVKALRAIGVDYSGKSGAPCLVVIVDRIDGAKNKEWLWHTDLNGVKEKTDGFVIERGDASFSGTFASPAKVVVDASLEARKTTKSSGNAAGSAIEMKISAVKVHGEDPTAGHFFFVGTLQRGPAPKVTVTGSGLDSVIRIGGQTVWFDGSKVVFGQ